MLGNCADRTAVVASLEESLRNLNMMTVNKMTDPDMDLSHLHVVLCCRADPGEGESARQTEEGTDSLQSTGVAPDRIF